MKKSISILLCMVLMFGMMSQAIANETNSLEIEPTVELTTEYGAYKNIFGCSNPNGTTTVYCFPKAVDAQTVASITGLPQSSVSSYIANAYATANIITDATVYSGDPSTNYGNESTLEIGFNEQKGIAHTYLQFDTSFLNVTNPNDILSAYFHLYQSANATVASAIIDAYLVETAWSESEITWNNKPDYYASEKIATIINATDSELERFPNDIYITKAVMAWIQRNPNYGLLIKEKYDSVFKSFASSEGNNVPCFVVTYATDELEQTPGIISNNSYYIVNRKSGKYMTAESLISGANVSQKTGNGTALQTWKLTYLNNGYYSIKVSDSTTCLEVAAGSTANNANIQVGSYTGASKQQWKVVRNWNGSYRLLPRSASTKAACVAATATADGTNVYQYTFTHNLEQNDEWSIISVNRGEASLFCFDESVTNIDTTPNMNLVSTIIGNKGYTSQKYLNYSAETGFQKLQSSPIFIFSGHGQEGAFLFFESLNTASSISTVNLSVPCIRIDELDPNDLAYQKLLLIQSCLTGCDQKYNNTNLAGMAYRLGSHNVSTNTCETFPGPDADWLLTFITNLSVSRSIGYAKEQADEALFDSGIHGRIPQRHDLGDDSVLLLSYPQQQTTANANRAYTANIQAVANSEGNKILLVNGNAQPLKKEISYTTTLTKKSYDVYTDSLGGIHTYDTATQKLQAYQPYTEDLAIGETEVAPAKAFITAKEFLGNLGYNIEGFICESSNEYAKDFRIVYRYELAGRETSEKIVMHLKADEKGNVFLTRFTADNYGLFSQDTEINNVSLLSSKELLAKYKNCQTVIGENGNIDRIFWDKDQNGNAVLKAVVTMMQGENTVTKIVDF